MLPDGGIPRGVRGNFDGLVSSFGQGLTGPPKRGAGEKHDQNHCSEVLAVDVKHVGLQRHQSPIAGFGTARAGASYFLSGIKPYTRRW